MRVKNVKARLPERVLRCIVLSKRTSRKTRFTGNFVRIHCKSFQNPLLHLADTKM
ncbi:hypothetical protein Pan258_36080 [Symmachiella dynata]|uniref:Uncharacterized protein n=1 Tax=Symmachiella dynata TaxID=2527995 RepID=A0A517ZS09_9PLAN|nr:hypothetical protein Pan258_36080 [Symmachiella dynata]QDU45258.1 hypothetical protein Mal52_37500 [Symmachiella dynata]